MSATAAQIRKGQGNLRRIRPVAVHESRRLRLGSSFANGLAFVVFVSMSLLCLFVPNKPEVIVALSAGIIVSLCIVRWPIVGTFTCTVLAILFDSLPSPYTHTLIADMDVFRNLSTKGLPQYFYLSIFEVVVILTLGSALVRRFHAHQKMVRGSVFFPVMAFGAMVVFGELNGLLTGGDFKISLWEIRPLGYMAILYILAVNTVTKPWHIRALLWVSVFATAARCVEGITRYFGIPADIRATLPVILEHDDSMVLVAVLALLVPAILWRNYLPRLLWVLIAMVPLLLYLIVINHRRAAYFCLILTLVAMIPLIWVAFNSKKAHTRMLQVFGLIAVVAPIYLGAYWNSSGTIGQPAQALRSVIAPDERDYLSNLYRDQENMNLRATIGRDPALGVGFGKPMDVVVQMVDLSDMWSLQLYMPHNNMLWLWMRMGLVGFCVFWMMAGSVLFLIVASVRLGVKRLAYLTSLDEGEQTAGIRQARGLSGQGAGLHVLHVAPRRDGIMVGRVRDIALDKAHKDEVHECAEFLALAFLALGMLVSMLTLALVDQGLMSPRLSSFWGVMLGTLAVGWELYKVRFELPSVRDDKVEKAGNINEYKELKGDTRHRVRVITGPQNAA